MWGMRPPEPPKPREARREKRNQSPHASIERIVFVPTPKVGYLIGHAGRTISGFESLTGAKIDIMKPNSRHSETPIKVTGNKIAVRHVVRMVMDLYGCNNMSSGLYQTRDPTGEKPLKATEKFNLKTSLVLRLVADHGARMEALEEEAGVTCVIHPDMLDATHRSMPAYVTGTAKEIARAEELFQIERDALGSASEYDCSLVDSIKRQNTLNALCKRKVWTTERSQMRSEDRNNTSVLSVSSTSSSSPSHPPIKTEPPSIDSGPLPAPSPSTLPHRQRRFMEESVLVTKKEAEELDLDEIRNVNRVRIKVVDAEEEEDENAGKFKKIVIFGSEARIMNAKQDVLHDLGVGKTKKNIENGKDSDDEQIRESSFHRKRSSKKRDKVIERKPVYEEGGSSSSPSPPSPPRKLLPASAFGNFIPEDETSPIDSPEEELELMTLDRVDCCEDEEDDTEDNRGDDSEREAGEIIK